MKKLAIFTAFLLLLAGCSKSALYNENLEVAGVDATIKASKPLEKSYIFMPSNLFGSKSFKPTSRLGEDDLDIDLGEYTLKGTERFFRNYFVNLEASRDATILSSQNLIIMPEITRFEYGFYSPDGIHVDAKPYVSYDLHLKIFKGGKQIYNKNISVNPRNFGELVFFAGGGTSYAQIGPVLQKAIANDYNVHAVEIFNAINSN